MSIPDTGAFRRDGEGGATYLAGGEAPVTFPPDRTALLVIDPVNDFLSEGGAGWEMTKNTVMMHDVIGNLKRAIEGARERGVPVLFGPMAYTEEDYAERMLQRRSGINRLMYERRMFLAGSWGADFHPELRPREDETVLLPHKGIDVFETDLRNHLQRMGITHLVIAGMTASLCCESTGRHAMEEGYDVTYLSDAIGAESIPAYEAAIHLSYPLIGNAVMEVEQFLATMDAPVQAGPGVQLGDTVRGSDGGEVGEVQQVIEASEEVQACLVVPRGLIIKKDMYIPLDAVVRRVGTEVFVNVPRLVIGEMPWGEPPSRADQQEKHGPRGEDVQKLYGSRSPSAWKQAL